MPLRRKALALEAWRRLAGAWALVRIVPFRFWRGRLGARVSLDAPAQAVAPETISILREAVWVHRWWKHLGRGRFTCLMLALSARGMLAQRGIESKLVLGVSREGQDNTPSVLGAHAWVLSCGWCVVGGEEAARFAPVAAYVLSRRNKP